MSRFALIDSAVNQDLLGFPGFGIGVLRFGVYHLQYTQASEECPSSSESVQFCQVNYLRPRWQRLTAVSAMKALTSEEEGGGISFATTHPQRLFLRNVCLGSGHCNFNSRAQCIRSL